MKSLNISRLYGEWVISLKSEKVQSKAYNHIIRKILLKVSIGIILSFITVLIIGEAGRGHIGNIITGFINKKYMLGWYTSSRIYWDYFRKYVDYALLVTMIIVFLVFFRALLSWFTKYFDEIIDGVNKLASGKNEEIIMSAELKFMSDKLNQVKDDLERSAKTEREIEKRKSDLLVYLAHDIKTPLTSVIGYLSLINENPEMETKQRAKYMGITLEKAYRLEGLINEFFEVARYNSKSVPLSKEKIDLSHMMVQIIDELYPVIKENKREVYLSIPENISIYADAEKIARVFNNLLKNAIYYSDDKCIEIFAKQKENKVLISFENIGNIPKDKLDSIFEKFYRIDKARQTSTGGSGLGLAIAKDIIELHSGSITVKSEKNYTIFTVILENLD